MTAVRKPALPAANNRRGVSRFEPSMTFAFSKRKIRSSPVYAGHAIKPLSELMFSRGRLQSRTGWGRNGEPSGPSVLADKSGVVPQAIQTDCRLRDGLQDRVVRKRSRRTGQRPVRPVAGV